MPPRKKKTDGDGVMDVLKEGYKRAKYLLGNRQHKSPKLEAFLKRFGNLRIVEMRIGRKPLQKALIALGNIGTLGAISSRVKQLGYDNVYHLFMWIRLENGSSWLFEKNQVIQINSVPSDMSSVQFLPVSLREPLTLNLVFERLDKTIPLDRLYIYDISSFNCQRFVLDVLTVNGLVNPKLQEFIYQNAGELLKENWLRTSARSATDLAAKLSVVIKGGLITK